MALNKQFFDSISIELVKRKYYNANKVDALLASIRSEALAMDEELSSLREQLAALQAQKAEISEAVMSAQLMSADIVQKARDKAGQIEAQAQETAQAIITQAQQSAAELTESARLDSQRTLESADEQMSRARAIHEELTGCKQRRQEYAVDKVEACFSMLRQQYQETIDSLNLKWQDFLCGLYDDDSMPDAKLFDPADTPVAVPEAQPQPDKAQADADPAPADLGEKVDAIAKELEELATV